MRSEEIRGPGQAGTGVIEFRLARDVPIPGFDEHVLSDGTRVYVAPESHLGGTDITSTETLMSETTAALILHLSEEAIERSAGYVHGLMAIFVDGRITAAPAISSKGDPSVILLTGLLPGQVQRLDWVIAQAPTAPTGAMISVVPRTTTIQAGDQVVVDVFVSGARNLRGIQVAVDISGGVSGSLDRGTLSIDSQRPDFVFQGHQAVHTTDIGVGRTLSALYTGGASVPGQAYVASFTYNSSPNARGDFEVQVRTARDTLLRDADGLPIGFRVGPPGVVSVGLVGRPAQRQ